MFNQQMAIAVGLIFFILFSGIYFYVHNLKNELKDLRLELAVTEASLMKERMNTDTLRESIQKQNEEFQRVSVANTKARKQLEEWKSKPPLIKYKVINEIREVKSNECEEIKAIIKSMRNIDYNSL